MESFPPPYVSVDDEKWTGQQRDSSSVPVQWSAGSQEISLISEDYFPMYFVAPGTKSYPTLTYEDLVLSLV